VEAYAVPSEDAARLVEKYAIVRLSPLFNDRLDAKAAA
jgi:hypothetical protein